MRVPAAPGPGIGGGTIRAPEGSPQPPVCPGLLKELAGPLGFPSTQEPAQEAEASRPTPEAEPAEGSGPKKVLKQTRIKSQGPYARHGEAAPGAGVRSASALGAQEEGSPESLAEREVVGGEAEQL